jgi:alpha-beta hydrolase superfamily lysophospholipase
MPSFTVCIINLVKFLTENYNIKDDGIYIYGKSSGGFITHYLAQTQSLKIKAAASLAPALSPMVSLPYHLGQGFKTTVNTEAVMAGVNETFTGASQFYSGEKSYVLDNVKKWRQIDAFFLGTDLSDEQVENIVGACYNAGNASSDRLKITDVSIDSNTTTTDILNNAKRWVPCPTKIWIAADDTTVYHDNSKMFVEMAQRAGSPCYLRSLPANTGKHHAVDTDTNAIKTTYQTKYGGSVQVPVAYAEMVDWFNRW